MHLLLHFWFAPKVFDKDGQRPAVTVRVSQGDTCALVCESIAATLDIADARVLLRDTRKGGQHELGPVVGFVDALSRLRTAEPTEPYVIHCEGKRSCLTAIFCASARSASERMFTL